MCTDTQTDAFGPVSTTLQAELAKEVSDLRDQLADARQATALARAEIRQMFEAFQEALLDVEDEGTQEAIKDFLEEVTGREFHLTKTFRARFTVEVTFRAKSQAEADEVELDINLARFCELEDFEVEDVSTESIDED